MAEIILKARTLLKNSTEDKWNLVENFIPKEGEVIVYNPDEKFPYPRLKTGNGINLPRDLPFVQTTGMNNIADKVKNKLIFGANQEYQYDGSKEVIVPVYTGDYSINN